MTDNDEPDAADQPTDDLETSQSDVTQTSHPTGEAQAAENAERESPA